MTVARSPAGRLGSIFGTLPSRGRAALINYLPAAAGRGARALNIDAMVAARAVSATSSRSGFPTPDPGWT